MVPWVPGMRAKCIKENWNYTNPTLWPRLPKIGDELTVREVYVCPVNNIVALRFEEIKCGIHHPTLIECGYVAVHFVPIVETDISIFTAMLEKKPVEEHA